MTAVLHAPASHPLALRDAAQVPPITRPEARALAEAELDRFLALVESLAPADWTRPTACTLWDVRQILAHQAGSYAGFASWREFRRQFGAPPRPGTLMEDVLSARQVADRAQTAPSDLIAELRAVGGRAILNRQRLPGGLRLLGVPHPLVGFLRLGTLLDIIYTRDTWMHRLDIARATLRPMVLTPEHDGRLSALVMRDLARRLAPKLGGRVVRFSLAGLAGGDWRVGPGAAPAATLQMDALDFNLRASGRCSFEDALARAALDGDRALAELALRESQVLY
jgi:uncharacterized protein (TIGR03083 family)